MYKEVLLATAVGIVSLLTSMDTGAHHSAAMFDEQKSVTVRGTVKLFQWTNPHCWIQMLVSGPGEPTEWSVELGSPAQLYNKGWKPGTLKAGDKIIVVIHPLRDGKNGGVFVSATDAAGSPLVTVSDSPGIPEQ